MCCRRQKRPEEVKHMGRTCPFITGEPVRVGCRLLFPWDPTHCPSDELGAQEKTAFLNEADSSPGMKTYPVVTQTLGGTDRIKEMLMYSYGFLPPAYTGRNSKEGGWNGRGDQETGRNELMGSGSGRMDGDYGVSRLPAYCSWAWEPQGTGRDMLASGLCQASLPPRM